MLSVRCSLAPLLLLWPLALATPIEQGTGANPPDKVKEDHPAEKFNSVTKSVDGVVQFTATISQVSRTGEPVRLFLKLKNLGKERLLVNDSPLDTFLVTVKTKDGTVVRATRYLEYIVERSKATRGSGRLVFVELAQGKEAGVTLPLNRLCDLSLQGEYLVSVEARFLVNTGQISSKVAIENLPFATRDEGFVRITNIK